MADVSDLKKGMGEVGKQFDGLKKQSDGMSKTLKTMAKGLLAAFSVKQIIKFGKQAVETSADLQAMDALYDQLFQGTGVTEKLEEISKATGINTTRLKKDAIATNSIIKAAYGEGADAVENQGKMLTLAADNAAAYNMSTEEATAAQISFLQGNYKAGNAIGVTANAQTVANWALKEYGVQMDKLPLEEQIQLRQRYLESIAEENGTVGQAARESGEYENVLLNLKDTWEQFLKVVGAPILQIVLVVMKALNEAVMWLTETVSGFEWGEFGDSELFTTMQEAVNNLVEFFKDNIPLMKAIWEDTLSVFAVIYDSLIAPLFETFMLIVSELVGFFGDNIPFLGDIWGIMTEQIKKNYEQFVKPTMEVLMQVVEVVLALFKAVWPAAQAVVKVAFDMIASAYNNILKPVFDVLIAIIKVILDKFEEHMPAIQETFAAMAKSIERAWNSIIKPAMDAIGAILSWLADMFIKYILPIVGWVADWFLKIARALIDNMTNAVNFVSGAIEGIMGFFTKLGQLPAQVGAFFGKIATGISDKMSSARDSVKNAIDKIKGFFNFKWSLPKLKMPSFSISGKFSLDPPSVPKFGISWNARGAIFKKPTVLANGQGVGDASNGFGSAPEVVAPLSDLKQMLGLDDGNKGNTIINLNGSYGFRDKEDMDYFMNELALAGRRG